MSLRPLLVVVAAALFTPAAFAQLPHFTDPQGRSWNQPRFATNLTWHEIAQICPQDGVTPCSGTLGGRDFTGYVWATNPQVQQMLSLYAPELATTPVLNGPAYTLPALMILGQFYATQAFYSNYSNSEYVGGWTATSFADGTVGGAGAGASWPVFSAGIGVGVGPMPSTRSTAYGVWLFRPAACRVDCDSSGEINTLDIFMFLNAWFSHATVADFDRSGSLETADVYAFLNAWFVGC